MTMTMYRSKTIVWRSAVMTPSPNIVSDRYIVINVRGAYEIFCAIEYLLQNIPN
jgi:hypothetical protein